MVKVYALSVLNGLFTKYAEIGISEENIKGYHRWGPSAKIPHKEMLRAPNRHLKPPDEIEKILLNNALRNLLRSVGIANYALWDEGLGWLAFRLIRPGPGDGYPFSCKFWGPAKQVFSIWLPVIGFDQELMINLIPGSHKKEYPKYLPENTHFTKDEFRLALQPEPSMCLRPKMKEGQALMFHPKTIHAEEVEKGESTRFNLEFRIVPL